MQRPRRSGVASRCLWAGITRQHYLVIIYTSIRDLSVCYS